MSVTFVKVVEVVSDADGVWTTTVRKVVLENHQDTYAKNCKM